MNAPILGGMSVFANQSIIRVIILVVDGVSLTTVSTALEPFQQVNSMLGEDRFHIQLVSRKSTNPMTSAGIPIHCHLTFTDVLAKLNLQNRPYLLIFYCGQVTSPTNQASAEGFTRRIAGQNVPVFALGAACFIAAKTRYSRNGLSAAIRCVIILRLLCGQTSLMHLQSVLTQKVFACAARLLP